MPFACFQSLVRTVTRNGVFLLGLVLLSVYFALPTVIPNDTGAFVFGAEFIKQNRFDILEKAVSSGAYDTAPDNIKDANERQLALLEITQGDDVAASLRAQAEIAQIDRELYKSGNLVGDETALKATQSLLNGLAGLTHPDLYETTASEPAVYRLSELFGTVPPLLLFVPPIAVAYAVFRAIEEDRLGFQFPASRLAKTALAAFATIAICVAGFAVAVVPGAIISLVRNGAGDPSYPVAFIQGGNVVELTVASALARSALLWFAAALFSTAIVAVLFAIASSAAPGCLVALALGFVPSIPQYFSETFILRDILPYLPTTYLYVSPVAGWPNYINGTDVFPIPGASWELGMVVLLAGSLALVLVTVGINLLRDRSPQPRKGGAHARVQ